MDTFETNTVLDARSFLGSYLKKEDLDGPQVVTLVDVYATELDGEKRPKLAATFAELGKPFIINSTNNRRLAQIFGTNNAAKWRGQVTLYVDNNIEYAGQTVGGLRVRPARANGSAVKTSEQPSRAQRQSADEQFADGDFI